MKKVKLFLVGSFAVTMSFTSCQKTCDEWHEGKKCETEIREKYYGYYSGTLTTDGQSQPSGSNIQEYPNVPNKLYLGTGIIFTLTNASNFSISGGATNGGINYLMSGSGNISENSLSYSMTIQNSSTGETGFAVFNGTR